MLRDGTLIRSHKERKLSCKLNPSCWEVTPLDDFTNMLKVQRERGRWELWEGTESCSGDPMSSCGLEAQLRPPHLPPGPGLHKLSAGGTDCHPTVSLAGKGPPCSLLYLECLAQCLTQRKCSVLICRRKRKKEGRHGDRREEWEEWKEKDFFGITASHPPHLYWGIADK